MTKSSEGSSGKGSSIGSKSNSKGSSGKGRNKGSSGRNSSKSQKGVGKGNTISIEQVGELLNVTDSLVNALLLNDDDPNSGNDDPNNGDERNATTLVDPVTGRLSEWADYTAQAPSGKTYNVFYNVTLKPNVLSLTPIQDLILSVTCQSVSDTVGTVTITFANSFIEDSNNNAQLQDLFPVGSVLAIDGAIFGPCWLRNRSIRNDDDLIDLAVPNDGIGYITQVVVTETNQVLMTLTPSGLSAMFTRTEFRMREITTAAPLDAGQTQQRQLAKIDFSPSKTFQLAPMITVPVELSGFIEGGIEDWDYIDENGKVEMFFIFYWEYRLTFLMELLIGTGQVALSEKKCLDLVDAKPVLTLPIVGWLGGRIPEFKAGIYAGLQFCGELVANMDFQTKWTFTQTWASGRQKRKLSATRQSGAPVEFDFEKLPNNDDGIPDQDGKLDLTQSPQLSSQTNFTLEITGRVGLEPYIEFAASTFGKSELRLFGGYGAGLAAAFPPFKAHDILDSFRYEKGFGGTALIRLDEIPVQPCLVCHEIEMDYARAMLAIFNSDWDFGALEIKDTIEVLPSIREFVQKLCFTVSTQSISATCGDACCAQDGGCGDPITSTCGNGSGGNGNDSGGTILNPDCFPFCDIDIGDENKNQSPYQEDNDDDSNAGNAGVNLDGYFNSILPAFLGNGEVRPLNDPTPRSRTVDPDDGYRSPEGFSPNPYRGDANLFGDSDGNDNQVGTFTGQCIGGGWGEPHYQTLDGLTYDCQAVGEFVVMRCPNLGLEIQARHVPFPVDIGQSASQMSSIVIQGITKGPFANNVRMQFEIADNPTAESRWIRTSRGGMCPVNFYIGGVLQDFNATSSFGDDTNTRVSQVSSTLFGIAFDAGLVMGIKVQGSPSFGCLLGTKVVLSSEFVRQVGTFIVGLAGSASGSVLDDWKTVDGSILDIPQNQEERLGQMAYDFCRFNWCIRDPTESLFFYAEGKSHPDYFYCDTPYIGRVDLSQASSELEELCGRNEACLIDGILGDLVDAQNVLEVQFEMNTIFNYASDLRVEPFFLRVGTFTDVLAALVFEQSDDNIQVERFVMYKLNDLSDPFTVDSAVALLIPDESEASIYYGSFFIQSDFAGDRIHFRIVPVIDGTERHDSIFARTFPSVLVSYTEAQPIFDVPSDSLPSNRPSERPSHHPTESPTDSQSDQPTSQPSDRPSFAPSSILTSAPHVSMPTLQNDGKVIVLTDIAFSGTTALTAECTNPNNVALWNELVDYNHADGHEIIMYDISRSSFGSPLTDFDFQEFAEKLSTSFSSPPQIVSTSVSCTPDGFLCFSGQIRLHPAERLKNVKALIIPVPGAGTYSDIEISFLADFVATRRGRLVFFVDTPTVSSAATEEVNRLLFAMGSTMSISGISPGFTETGAQVLASSISETQGTYCVATGGAVQTGFQDEDLVYYEESVVAAAGSISWPFCMRTAFHLDEPGSWENLVYVPVFRGDLSSSYGHFLHFLMQNTNQSPATGNVTMGTIDGKAIYYEFPIETDFWASYSIPIISGEREGSGWRPYFAPDGETFVTEGEIKAILRELHQIYIRGPWSIDPIQGPSDEIKSSIFNVELDIFCNYTSNDCLADGYCNYLCGQQDPDCSPVPYRVCEPSTYFCSDIDGWFIGPALGETPSQEMSLMFVLPPDPEEAPHIASSGTGVEDELWYFYAPSKFLGDQSAAYGNYLRFDMKKSQTGTASTIVDTKDNVDVFFYDGSVAAIFFRIAAVPSTDWVTYSIPLREGVGWRDGSELNGDDFVLAPESLIRQVLANVQVLGIRGSWQGPWIGVDLFTLEPDSLTRLRNIVLETTCP